MYFSDFCLFLFLDYFLHYLDQILRNFIARRHCILNRKRLLASLKVPLTETRVKKQNFQTYISIRQMLLLMFPYCDYVT